MLGADKKCLKCFLNFTEKRIGLMNIIYADYNIYHNSIDICTYAGYILRIDCAKAEEGLKTTPNSECALNALAIDNPVKYNSYFCLFALWFIILNKNSIKHNVIGNRSPMRMPT